MVVVEFVVNILLLIAAVLLVVVVLLQDSKNSGLGSAFGSDTTSLSSARSKKASREKQLQKLTVIFGIVVAVLAIAMLMIPAIENWVTPDKASAMVSVIRGIA